MDKQYGEFVGVDSLHVALITADTEEAYTPGIPEYLAPAAEISSDTATDNSTTYYDNVPGFTYNSEGVTTLKITISGIPAEKAAKYLGKYYDEATGLVLDTGEPNPPDCALSFRFNKGPDGYRYYQYLKGTFSGGSEEAASKGEKIDARTYELTYTAIVTTHQWNVNGEEKGLKRIYADTADAKFTSAATWFDAVKVPATTP